MTSRPRQLKLTRGTTLFSAGAPCRGFVELTRGTIRVSMTAANGREVVLYRVGPGDVCLQTFSCLIHDRAYRAEGVAETDLEGRILPPDAFRDRLANDAAFRDEIFRAVARRFADYEELVETVALTGFDTRLARALLRLADASGDVRATHEHLAAETGSARAVVSRRLGALAEQGLVALRRGRVSLLDVGELQRIAAGER